MQYIFIALVCAVALHTLLAWLKRRRDAQFSVGDVVTFDDAYDPAPAYLRIRQFGIITNILYSYPRAAPVFVVTYHPSYWPSCDQQHIRLTSAYMTRGIV